MSFTPVKSKTKKNLFDLKNTCKVNIDSIKFQSAHNIYFTGLNNYILVQKFSNFKWPAWIYSLADSGQYAPSLIPLVFVNGAMRDSLYFNNFLSSDGLHIDPSGMISPSYDHWSIEMWILEGSSIHRAADDWKNVVQERDTKNSIIHSSWKTGIFTLRQIIYGARSAVDEAVIDVECHIKGAKKASLLFTVRPYDLFRLGGLDSVEYVKNSNSVSIRHRRLLCSVSNPDFIVAGGGKTGGDINLAELEQTGSDSPYGLATLGLGFELKKGDSRFTFRVALDQQGGLSAGNFDFKKVKDDYASYASIRIRNGANFHLPRPLLEDWLYGAKISLLNCSIKNLKQESGKTDFRTAFYVIYGNNRMGYSKESIMYIDQLLKEFIISEKNFSFDDMIDACYLLNSIADCFIHIRDTDFLRSRFENIKKLAHALYTYAKRLKKTGSHGRNSLRDYYVAEEHPYDYILISHALAQHSYMARCLGIFGDEIKFKKESDRVAGIVSANAFGAEGGWPDNEFIIYNIFAGYPFRIDAIPESAIRSLIGRIGKYITDKPLLITSLGWDIFLTLIVANNLIFIKDMRGYEIVENLLKMRDREYVIPEYIHPATGRGNWGESAPVAVSSMIFSTIRNLMFIDYPERLDLFPLPRPEWFEPGKEILIDDAPSRFGLLSFRSVSTENEIQIHFDKLPKFVPPDIMINLPLRTKIKQEDDFILKREDGRSFVINGWPSILRFIRK